MSRPVKPRVTKSYARDIENLGRLRLALVVDPKLPPEKIRAGIHACDVLIDHLVQFRKVCEASG